MAPAWGPDLVTGADGRPRCPWGVSAPEYVDYHDHEWGRFVRDDAGIYERIVLESFQSGLSWLTILRKREHFRRAFAGFDLATVAGFDDADRARLLDDAGIIRNRTKIEAAIANARAALELPGGVAALVWSHAPDQNDRPAPVTVADVPSVTDESTAMARDLKRHGFRFIGPTTAYALMQACGLVNDHLAGCAFRDR
ncbi:MAG: DNA-3-methyladenine glycosylase I [Acidimicrobiales bacterium]